MLHSPMDGILMVTNSGLMDMMLISLPKPKLYSYTGYTGHAVTSIKQSPVFKGHFFCPDIENFI
jgi:hypothetical protein